MRQDRFVISPHITRKLEMSPMCQLKNAPPLRPALWPLAASPRFENPRCLRLYVCPCLRLYDYRSPWRQGLRDTRVSHMIQVVIVTGAGRPPAPATHSMLLISSQVRTVGIVMWTAFLLFVCSELFFLRLVTYHKSSCQSIYPWSDLQYLCYRYLIMKLMAKIWTSKVAIICYLDKICCCDCSMSWNFSYHLVKV